MPLTSETQELKVRVVASCDASTVSANGRPGSVLDAS